MLKASRQSADAFAELRRFDEALASFYLLRIGLGFQLPPPAEYFTQERDEDRLFDGMREVDDALGGCCVYVPYEPDGGHSRRLLDAFGIPGELAFEIEGKMRSERSLNPSMTRKQATICLNLDLFSARCGIELDREALRGAVYRGALEFEEDGPCELMDDDRARAVHERVLAAARRQGFAPYAEFYGDAELGSGRSPVSLDPSIVTDEDLRRLTDSLDLASAR